ncbi:hypothetical protein IAR50_006356 [Cryptococcus sp. DSM 104548]
MPPAILSTVLPIPSALLLLTLLIYHLTPLLSLFTNLTPPLRKLSDLIPHPRRARNLPREFFNLPPRPGSPEDTSKLTWGGIGARLGVRGKLMLLLAGEGFVSLVAGWVVLEIGIEGTRGIWAGVAVSVTLLPVTAAWMALFIMVSKPAHTDRHHVGSKWSSIRRAIFNSGGITHTTLYPRIFPISIASAGAAAVLAGALGDKARYVILAMSAASVAVLGGCSAIGMWQMIYRPSEGLIRLRGESRMSLYEKQEGYPPEGISHDDEREAQVAEMGEMDEEERLRVGYSWLSSPSRTEATMISSFDFSPSSNVGSQNTYSPSKSSHKTPKSKAPGASLRTPPTMPHSAMSPSSFQHLSPNAVLSPYSQDKSNEDSWLSQDTNSRTMSEWSFPSPEPAVTRPRSPTSPAFDANLPRPGQVQGAAVKASDSTAYTHTLSSIGSPLRSPDNSIIAAYSPDPFRPLPRGFESLSSYPLSPSQMAGKSRASLVATRAIGSVDDPVTCVPVERVSAKGSSTWTLESCPPASGPTASGTTLVEAKTLDRRQSRIKPIDLRAPPPPPMPANMPLPPTPTFARSSTLWNMSSGAAGKDSMELLMGGDEREWVAVESNTEALQSWGRGGRGVGLVAVAGSICCLALALPLLLQGPSSVAILLYLISIILPSPFLVFLSYILRYRHPKQGSNRKKVSTSTAATLGYKSLALTSESQLSLPVSISPKLTPPQATRVSTVNINGKHVGKLVQQKPSLTTFLSTDNSTARGVTFEGKVPARRHTVYGNFDMRDMEAEEAMRKTNARKSTDVWFEEGHAVQGGGVFARAAEMFKPVPAMRVLESQRRSPAAKNVVKDHQGGVVSMLAKRASSLFEGGWTGMHGEADSRRAETTGRYDDASDDASFISARSGVAVSITAPSPDKRASRISRNHSVSSDGGNEAQIHEAKRGRMSNGPTLIYNQRGASGVYQRRTSGRGDEYELDWLTAGVLPNLVPAIKIGNDIRVEPAPRSAVVAHDYEDDVCDTPRANRRPGHSGYAENDNESFIGTPSFHSLSFKDQSTPHQSRHNGKHTHTRSFSSSTDLSKSPEYYTAESHGQSTSRVRRNASAKSNQTAREHELKEKTSFGLPKFNKEDFTEEMRKSFDELSRPVSSGFDLPPIPATLARPSNTPERVKERLPTESSMAFSKSYVADMQLALRLGALPSSQSLTAAFDLPRDASDADISQDEISLANTLNTDAEGAVEEMEAMMAMDTPTRAGFVISPPPSSYGEDGRSSRASVRSVSTTTSSTTATSTGYSTSYAVEAPPVPDIPSPYRQSAHAAAPAVLSHPHPPPLAKTASASTFGPVSTQRFSITEPHPPVQHLLPKKSTETMRSNWTASESEASMPTPLQKAIDHKPSKQELKLVQQLNERNAEREAAESDRKEAMQISKSQSYLEFTKSKPVEKKGLKPLTLVEKRLSNEVIVTPQAAPAKSGLPKSKSATGSQKKFSVLLQEDKAGSKVSLGGRSAKGKENDPKGSKTSMGSGVLGVRGLRA